MIYLNQNENYKVWQMVKQNPCCDHVGISEDECSKLKKMFNLKFQETVPCDLIITNTIPLKNVGITVFLGNREQVDFKVHIFGCFDEETLKKEKQVTVGVLEFSDKEFVLIDIEYGKNVVFQGLSGFKYDSKKDYLDAFKEHLEFRKSGKYQSDKDYVALIGKIMGIAMEAFYVIQIALLHPITQQLFKKPSLSPIGESGKKKNSKKKRVTKYIKKYYIDPLELEQIANRSTEKTRTYTCLAWYVCGHWRTYQNGTKVFIQPYWKGTMRNERQYVANIERIRKIGQLEEHG